MRKNWMRVLLIGLSLTIGLLSGCQIAPDSKEENSSVSSQEEQEMTTNTETNNPNKNEDVLPSPLPTEPYSTLEFSKDDTIHATLGTWSWEDGVLTGSNIDGHNCYAMTDLYTAKGVAWTLEADLEILSGRAAGFAFGVKDQSNPVSTWYCFNVDKGPNNSRLFSTGDGTSVGNGEGTQRPLTDEEIARTKHHLKVEYDADGDIRCTLNGVLVAEYCETTYSGGFLGFYTYYSTCKISNISYKIGTMHSPATNMEVEMGGQVHKIDANALAVPIDFGKAKGGATIRFNLMEGYMATIQNKTYSSGTVEHSFLPAYGEDTFTVVFSDKNNNTNILTLVTKLDIADDVVYTDQYRPQYHFSPKMYYMNDPNGLVYNATTGEYHLFFQLSPGLIVPGTQVWGHAVSKDLLNWKEIGIAIDREPNGGKIYSGSAVIDYNNTTGFFDDSIPPASRMVAIYTVPSTYECQNLAYSLDDGYTWIRYDGNPVLTASASKTPFRDPKVSWIEDPSLPNGGIWLAIVGGNSTTTQLFTSPDLKTWTFNSYVTDVNGNTVTSECPDLFKIAVDGDPNNIKYIYSGGGVFYIVGDLIKNADGMYVFQASQARQDFAYGSGKCSYATQSFFNIPNGDTVTISWCRAEGGIFEDKYWSGCMTLPYKIGLTTMNDGTLRMTQNIIEDIDSLRGDKLLTYESTTLDKDSSISVVKSKSFTIDAAFKMEKNTEFRIDLFSNGSGKSAYIIFKCDDAGKVSAFVSNVDLAMINGASWTIPLELNADGTIDVKIYGDASIMEIFINGGKYVVCKRIFPSQEGNQIVMDVLSGAINVSHLDCYQMNSIWRKTDTQ